MRVSFMPFVTVPRFASGFLQTPLATGTLAFGWWFRSSRPTEDFHLQESRPAWRTNKGAGGRDAHRASSLWCAGHGGPRCWMRRGGSVSESEPGYDQKVQVLCGS